MKRFPDNNVPEAALLYADLYSWATFPVPPGTKRSYKAAKYSNGRRWGATNNPAIIRRTFKRWPHANIGIPTGAENGFWVLECDTPKGHNVDGIASLRALEHKHGRLPKTLMAMSPSGSLHYYFRWPKRGLIICNSASKIAPGIDIRGEGGMVVAPPSIKEGVGRYRFLNWGTAGAYAPPWLLKLAAHRHNSGGTHVNGNGKMPQQMMEIDAEDVDLIKAALEVIQRACAASGKWPYTIWFEIGCALHFELGDEGFAIFDAWSRASPTYNAAHCAAKWRECAKIFTYRIGTIVHYANQESPGWRAAYEAKRTIEAYSFFRK